MAPYGSSRSIHILIGLSTCSLLSLNDLRLYMVVPMYFEFVRIPWTAGPVHSFPWSVFIPRSLRSRVIPALDIRVAVNRSKISRMTESSLQAQVSVLLGRSGYSCVPRC